MDICEAIRDFIIGILSSYLTWGVAMLAVIVLLVWIIVLLYKHNEYLKVFNKQISGLQNSRSKIEIEVKSIRFYTAIVAYVVLFACFLAVIHYISHTLPRLAEYGKTQNLGIDYLGLIVAIFAIIVTLLVTWQIFSTIKAKEELRETQREIKESLNAKINNIRGEIKSVRYGFDAEKIRDAIERHGQLTKDQQRIIREIWETEHNAIAKTNLYKWAESKIKENADDKTIAKEWVELSATGAEKFSYIDGRQATLEELTEIIRIARAKSK